MEKRRGGITFQVDKMFEYRGMQIPQSELYDIACTVNLADMVKQGLAIIWFRRKHEAAKQLAAQQQHDTSRQNAKMPADTDGQR